MKTKANKGAPPTGRAGSEGFHAYQARATRERPPLLAEPETAERVAYVEAEGRKRRAQLDRAARDQLHSQRRQVVALNNALATVARSKGGVPEGPASPEIQKQTRALIDVCRKWACLTVPQLLYRAVVGELQRQTRGFESLPWWWCHEVKRQLLWLFDAATYLDHARYVPPGPERDQQILSLKGRGGHTDRQIEQIVGAAHGTVAAVMRRAKRRKAAGQKV